MSFVGMVFTFVFLIVVVLGVVAVSIMKIMKSPGVAENGQSPEDETRLIQQLHQDLVRMEERIESLETILLEGDGKEKSNETS